MKTAVVRVIALVLCVGLIFGLATFFMQVPGGGWRRNANGVSADTVMIEMNEGYSVTADEYFYYAFMSRDSYISQYGAEIFEIIPSLSDNVLTQVDGVLIGNNAFAMWGKEAGFELSEEDAAVFDVQLAEMTASLKASGKRIEAYFKENNLTVELFRRIFLRDAYVEKFLSDYLTPDHPALAVNDKEINDYIDKNGVMGAKHILFAFDSYSSEDKCRATARDVLERIKEGEDFDTLMNEYTDDASGLSANPDGYVFRTGEFVPEFEEATKSLKTGETSELIETEYGYHIIQRIDVNKDQVKIWVQQNKVAEKRDEYEQRLNPRATEAREGLNLIDMKPVV